MIHQLKPLPPWSGQALLALFCALAIVFLLALVDPPWKVYVAAFLLVWTICFLFFRSRAPENYYRRFVGSLLAAWLILMGARQLEVSVPPWFSFHKDSSDPVVTIVATVAVAMLILFSLFLDERTRRSNGSQVSPPIIANLVPWLKSLLESTGKVDIRGIGSGAGRSQEAQRYDIEQLYTTLHGEMGDGQNMARQQSVNLAELLPKHHRLLIEGQPGAGKTTFLRLITAMLCKDLLKMAHPSARSWRVAHLGLSYREPARVPMFLRLSHLAALLAKDQPPVTDDHSRLLDLLDHTPNAVKEWRGHWTGLLGRGEVMLLLDGLDEVADEGMRERVFAIVQDALDRWPNCPMVVTSRPIGVARIKNMGFHHVVIAPFGMDQIQEFITRWVRALHEKNKPDHQQSLLQAIMEKPAIQQLAANPVMLTCLCVVHWNEGKLPEGRNRVYQAVLRWLIAARSEKRLEAGYQDQFAMEAFAALALAMMMGGHHDKQAVFDVNDGAKAVAPLVALYFPDLTTPIKQERRGREWLAFECLGSGIVEEVGDRLLKFWHLTFQEHLAAKALAGMGDDAEGHDHWWPVIRQHLTNPQWRESVALFPAALFDDGGRRRVDLLLQRVLSWVDAPATLVEDARVAGIMARLLQPMTAYQYQRPMAIEQGYQQVLKRAMAIFTREGATQVPMDMRFEAGEAIGQAGDPRLHDLNLIAIPGTGWQLGKYPVTVMEYQRFVEHNGYQAQRWWDEVGWKIRHEQDWESPDEWNNQLLHPNRPVTYVSWFEAMAYCRWLSDQKKMTLRLPDEALWEKATQGSFPWGEEEPTPELANFDRHVGSPTPVGLYPAGDGPFGHCDLAGNVWEWQRNRYKNENATDTPIDVCIAGSDELLTLRGGAWLYDAGALRSAYRLGSHAGSRSASWASGWPPRPRARLMFDFISLYWVQGEALVATK